MIESPWSKKLEGGDAMVVLREGVRSVRKTIDRAQASKDLKEIALDALIKVEDKLPAVSLEEIQAAGGAREMIYSGLILTASKMTSDPKIARKLNDAFGKYFESGARDLVKIARKIVDERFKESE